MQKKQDITLYDECLDTPFASIGLRFDKDVLVAVEYVEPGLTVKPANAKASNACKQILDYCSKTLPGMIFDLQLSAMGTSFQRRVWKELQKIPVGEVVTYGDLAKRLNTSARAVGNACRRNPLPVVIPCHRVVSKTGLGGYSGRTSGELLRIKEWLLKHENAISGY